MTRSADDTRLRRARARRVAVQVGIACLLMVSPGCVPQRNFHSSPHPVMPIKAIESGSVGTWETAAPAAPIPLDGWSAPATQRISVRDDVHRMFPDLSDDTTSLVTWHNGIALGAAGGLAIGLRHDVDQSVREKVAESPLRWGDGSRTLRWFGEPATIVPAECAVYGLSVLRQDEELHDFSRAMIHAHALSQVATVAVKGIADTRRPTDEFLDGRWGFPSAHSAGAFAVAASIDEFYGWRCGVPAYVLAGLVGWSRIDEREHDLSDVVFGSALGFVIGHSVARRHLERNAAWELRPWIEPQTGGAGVQLDVAF